MVNGQSGDPVVRARPVLLYDSKGLFRYRNAACVVGHLGTRIEAYGLPPDSGKHIQQVWREGWVREYRCSSDLRYERWDAVEGAE